jgi:signal transduction protein with GAF and PtsI domain
MNEHLMSYSIAYGDRHSGGSGGPRPRDRASRVGSRLVAPYHHAAIVARELGIPAVAGCGNATLHLRTGDLVRVDGAKGTIEMVKGAPEIRA